VAVAFLLPTASGPSTNRANERVRNTFKSQHDLLAGHSIAVHILVYATGLYSCDPCVFEFCYQFIHRLHLVIVKSVHEETEKTKQPTFPPPTRCGGSVTFNVSRRGERSTPKSAAESFSMGFFLAFMMFGREA
jgi:hypothetical protein